MKMKLFFRISVLALCISMSLSSFAQDQQDRISVEDIDWSAYNQSLGSIVGTSDAPKITYLYATTPKKFVTVGGRYGAQPILAEVGMNFYVEKAPTMLTVLITSTHGWIILQLLMKMEMPTILVSSLPWMKMSVSFLWRTMKL